LLLAIGLLIYFSRRIPEIKIAAIWTVLPLLPHFNTLVFTSDELIHDRYLYVPMIGVAFLLAALITRAGQIPKLRLSGRTVAIASILVLSVFCAATIAQNRKWRSEESLWSSASARAQNSRMVHTALGYLAEQKGDLPGAVREYEAALAVNPDMIDAMNSVAFVHARLGQWDQASRYFERLVVLTPDKAVSHFNLSFAYAVQKRYEDAASEQGVAIDLDPNGPRADEWRARLAQLEKTIAGNRTVNAREN
jgi:protein O-mannosyl-transferase